MSAHLYKHVDFVANFDHYMYYSNWIQWPMILPNADLSYAPSQSKTIVNFLLVQ